MDRKQILDVLMAQRFDDSPAFPQPLPGRAHASPVAGQRDEVEQSVQNAIWLDEAIHGLDRRHPGFSAREGTLPAQRLLLWLLVAALAAGLLVSPVETLYGLGALLNLVFICSVLLRVHAALRLPPETAGEQPTPAAEQLPVYSILVPLYREERVVAGLVRHLAALDYPRERLDICLILEQDDEATLAAARAVSPPDHFRFVVVPEALPRTKPKALNYALQQARGEFVVVFDAEDRPEPDQLLQAVAAFARADDRLACLQAPLDYYNAADNWLTRQAMIEYVSLFRGLLPALQRLRLPIPLGGTSNHFRAGVLRALGGWDAFNVTEDADLGMRLARFGYRCEMLDSATHEEACARGGDWLRQRTRWLKGWLQTYLVHMRRPLLLWRQLGAHGFFGFQIVLGAQVLSLLAHPVFMLFMLEEAANGRLFNDPAAWYGWPFWLLALGNLGLGYLSSIWLGAATLRRAGCSRLLPHLALMPLYWLAMSLAAFRALVHYVTKPFHWEKTAHGISRFDDDAQP